MLKGFVKYLILQRIQGVIEQQGRGGVRAGLPLLLGDSQSRSSILIEIELVVTYMVTNCYC